MSVVRHNDIFFGWRVVGAAFVLAVLGWGIGFYGLPIYLQTVQQNRGWPVALISIAVTTHSLLVQSSWPIGRHSTRALVFPIWRRRVQSFWRLASSAGPVRPHPGNSSSPHCSAAQVAQQCPFLLGRGSRKASL
jgi:hypothetical protein